MKQVEEILIAINRFKAIQHFSLDIYYNDIDKTFVCKVHNFGDNLDEYKHFRNKELIDSLIEAYEFCNKELINY